MEVLRYFTPHFMSQSMLVKGATIGKLVRATTLPAKSMEYFEAQWKHS